MVYFSYGKLIRPWDKFTIELFPKGRSIKKVLFVVGFEELKGYTITLEGYRDILD